MDTFFTGWFRNCCKFLQIFTWSWSKFWASYYEVASDIMFFVVWW